MTNAQFGTVMRRVLYGVAAVIIGLISFALSLNAGSVVRKKEKERRAIEKEEARRQQEMTEQMRSEAKQAMAEAEAMKKEAEEVKLKFAPKEAEETAEAAEENILYEEWRRSSFKRRRIYGTDHFPSAYLCIRYL